MVDRFWNREIINRISTIFIPSTVCCIRMTSDNKNENGSTVCTSNQPRCVQDRTHIANCYCMECDESFCQPCAFMIHTAPNFAKHKINLIGMKGPLETNANSLCTIDPKHGPIEVHCKTCARSTCTNCDRLCHQTGARARHIRTLAKDKCVGPCFCVDYPELINNSVRNELIKTTSIPNVIITIIQGYYERTVEDVLESRGMAKIGPMEIDALLAHTQALQGLHESLNARRPPVKKLSSEQFWTLQKEQFAKQFELCACERLNIQCMMFMFR